MESETKNPIRRLWWFLSEVPWSVCRWLSGARTAGDDPLNKATEAYGDLDEGKYRAELELVDRYQSFVSEFLRLSLLGIAVFGFLYKEMLANIDQVKLGDREEMFVLFDYIALTTLLWWASLLAVLGVVAFGIAAGSALIFRFAATEGARYYIEGLRFCEDIGDINLDNLKRAQNSLDERKDRIVITRLTKPLAVVWLGLGGYS